jgi:hypothetical protein
LHRLLRPYRGFYPIPHFCQSSAGSRKVLHPAQARYNFRPSVISTRGNCIMVVFGKPRALALLICALMIGLYGIGSHPVPAQAQLEITATVDTDRLFIRSAPSTRGTVLGELTRGQTIKLVARAPYVAVSYTHLRAHET